MIKELTWDSVFFGRKIGEFTGGSCSSFSVKKALDRAKEDGYRYLRCKLKSQDIPLIKRLESLGFYLTDIGVILGAETGRCMQGLSSGISKEEKVIRPAARQDIPALKKMVASLFLESRFYSDPFFSKAMADGLYETWIENSVKGQAADVVFVAPGAGFVTCRRSGKSSGEIVLIGVKKNVRGKGVGSALVGEAMKWFVEQQIRIVTVRTQLKNLRALNFYVKLGFLPKEYDIILGKIL